MALSKITTESLLDGEVTDAKISALAASKLTGTVADSQIAGMASSKLSGTVPTARLGSGTASSSTFLRGDSTYAEAGGGGGWTLIGSATASSSASLTVTGLTGLPAMIIGVDLHPATDQVFPYLRMGDSSGIDSGSTDYFWHCCGEAINGDNDNTTTNGKTDWEASQIEISHIGSTDGESGNASDCGVSFEGKMYNGRGAEMIPGWQGATLCRDSDTVMWDMRWGGARKSKITTDRVQFLFSSGNIVSGSIYVYELAIT